MVLGLFPLKYHCPAAFGTEPPLAAMSPRDARNKAGSDPWIGRELKSMVARNNCRYDRSEIAAQGVVLQ